MKITKRYDSPRRVPIFFDTPSLTQQNFRESCDVNVIVKRSIHTGLLVDPLVVNSSRVPKFGDFSGDNTFDAVQNKLAAVSEYFDKLPAEVREHYKNSPSAFVDGLSSPDELAYLREHGIVTPDDAPSEPPAPLPDKKTKKTKESDISGKTAPVVEKTDE